MHSPDAEIPKGSEGISGSDAYRSLGERNHVLDSTAPEFALAERAANMWSARIYPARRLVLGNSLSVSALRFKNPASRDMSKCAAR